MKEIFSIEDIYYNEEIEPPVDTSSLRTNIRTLPDIYTIICLKDFWATILQLFIYVKRGLDVPMCILLIFHSLYGIIHEPLVQIHFSMINYRSYNHIFVINHYFICFHKCTFTLNPYLYNSY